MKRTLLQRWQSPRDVLTLYPVACSGETIEGLTQQLERFKIALSKPVIDADTQVWAKDESLDPNAFDPSD